MIQIEEQKVMRLGLDIFEYVYLRKLVVNQSIDAPCISEIIYSLMEKEYLDEEQQPTKKAIALFPKTRDYIQLATDMRELFPKGKKAGRHPWRCSVNALTAKLKTLDRQGMNVYDNERIIKVVKGYVDGFDDMTRDNEMMLCMYFTIKNGNSTLLALLESYEDDVEEEVSNEKAEAAFTFRI